MNNSAMWITAPCDFKDAAYTIKKIFKINKDIKSAILYVTAAGIYVPYLNGKRIGKNVLAPGWTSYKQRIQYQEYDITSLLEKENLIEIGVGQGWAVGYIGWVGNHMFFDHTSLIAWVDICYMDGSLETIVTNTDWDVYSSEITFSEIYHGETVDRTVPIQFVGKAVQADVSTTLIPQEGEFITEHERIAPIELIHTPAGETVIDFGQNMTGYVEVKISGPRGSRIVIQHAEVLDKDGNFYTDNLRSARNENTYILSGNIDVFKPSFSFQGFRYIKLVEYPFQEVQFNSFRAIAVHSDIKRTGYFNCGNKAINQLYHNIIWGQKSNFLDIPTDCPQRDERLAWTGDAQVFCRTASINFDTEKFFKKWLGDIALEQGNDGAVHGVVPQCFGKKNTRISAGWGDCACIIPWQLYLSYGDKELLRKNFPIMKKWVNYVRNFGPDEFLWLGGVHYGDWLALDADEDSLVGSTSNDLIASAFFAYSTSLLVKAGDVLGEDMSEYRLLHKKILDAFRSYFMEGGMPKKELPLTEIPTKDDPSTTDIVRLGMTQTALVLILYFNLCEENEKTMIAEKLAEMIYKNGTLMSTGFIGTPYILHALSDNGYVDLAYELLLQEKSPSWLYSVNHGATTIWEHWDSIKEDGTFWDKEMNSFNHYSYGAVFDWIFGVSMGINLVSYAPAYKEIILKPHPSEKLGFAEASIASRNGKITSKWYYKNDKVYYEFQIPDGVTAHLSLPSGYTETLYGGKYHFVE